MGCSQPLLGGWCESAKQALLDATCALPLPSPLVQRAAGRAARRRHAALPAPARGARRVPGGSRCAACSRLLQQRCLVVGGSGAWLRALSACSRGQPTPATLPCLNEHPCPAAPCPAALLALHPGAAMYPAANKQLTRRAVLSTTVRGSHEGRRPVALLLSAPSVDLRTALPQAARCPSLLSSLPSGRAPAGPAAAVGRAAGRRRAALDAAAAAGGAAGAPGRRAVPAQARI